MVLTAVILMDLIFPDYLEITERIITDNPKNAYIDAMRYTKKLADDYLSDTDTGFTTVRLLELTGYNGNISFDSTKAIVKTSMLEHFLIIISEENSDDN